MKVFSFGASVTGVPSSFAYICTSYSCNFPEHLRPAASRPMNEHSGPGSAFGDGPFVSAHCAADAKAQYILRRIDKAQRENGGDNV